MTFLEDVRADLDFTIEDEARLKAMFQLFDPHLPEIAQELARRASKINPTASADRVHEWLRSGLVGPWDASYLADRGQRGRDMVARGLPSQLIVLVVHYARTAYLRLLSAANAPLVDRLTIHKLIDLELAVMLNTYESEMENQLMVRERRWQTEQRAAMQTLSIGFAHELRNPLNSAKLQFDVLERRIRRYINDPLVGEPVSLARQEIERLCDLVEDFLSYAQPPPLAPITCDIVTLAEHVVETDAPLAHDRGVELTVKRPDSRWHARVDCDKVRQAIQNLVRNAIEAAPKGGHVTVEVTGPDGHVHVIVTDDGGGIPEKVRARMFEPFFSTKDTGTGLGMSIVQSVVAMHGGTIDVTTGSTGTRIDMSLPKAE